MPERNAVLDQYMKILKRKLGLMSGKKKKAILMEVEAHLMDVAEEEGGLNDEGYKKAIERFGEPSKIAQQMRYDYGKGPIFSTLAIIAVAFLSLLTVPIASDLPSVGGADGVGNLLGLISVLFTLITFAVIIFVGWRGGRWQGLMVGIVAWGIRSIIFLLIFLFSMIISNNTPININVGLGECCGVTFVSILMILAGFLSGRALKKLVKGELL